MRDVNAPQRITNTAGRLAEARRLLADAKDPEEIQDLTWLVHELEEQQREDVAEAEAVHRSLLRIRHYEQIVARAQFARKEAV